MFHLLILLSVVILCHYISLTYKVVLLLLECIMSILFVVEGAKVGNAEFKVWIRETNEISN
jgi:hypothetical protein